MEVDPILIQILDPKSFIVTCVFYDTTNITSKILVDGTRSTKRVYHSELKVLVGCSVHHNRYDISTSLVSMSPIR